MNRALSLLAGAGSLAVVAAETLTESTYTGSSGLHDLAKATGRYFGTATNLEASDSYYTTQLENTADFGMYTPANAMKWDATEATQGVFTYTSADALVAVANTTGARVRCHNLVWHSQIPTWVQSLGKDDLLDALTNHVTNLVTYFGDTCYAWDVVNEVIDDDANYRESFWYTTTGTEYISTAFTAASAVKEKLGLSVKLYYNDYNTNVVNAKSTAGYNMVKGLLDDGIEVNGVGFQSHMTVGIAASTADQVTNFQRFADLGLEVAITELDVDTTTASPTTDEQDEQVTLYEDTIAACAQVTACVGVTIWDFDDTYTWISDSAPLPWYQPDGEGTELVRKAAYDGIVSGWANATTSTTYSSAGSSTSSTTASTTAASATASATGSTAGSTTGSTTGSSAASSAATTSATTTSSATGSTTESATDDESTDSLVDSAIGGDADSAADDDADSSTTSAAATTSTESTTGSTTGSTAATSTASSTAGISTTENSTSSTATSTTGSSATDTSTAGSSTGSTATTSTTGTTTGSTTGTTASTTTGKSCVRRG